MTGEKGRNLFKVILFFSNILPFTCRISLTFNSLDSCDRNFFHTRMYIHSTSNIYRLLETRLVRADFSESVQQFVQRIELRLAQWLYAASPVARIQPTHFPDSFGVMDMDNVTNKSVLSLESLKGIAVITSKKKKNHKDESQILGLFYEPVYSRSLIPLICNPP